MNRLFALTLTILLTALLTPALAERGDGRQGRNDNRGYASTGERIEQHFDRKGDRIERRFDHRADRAEDHGKYAKAEKLRAKGDRIDNRFDRKGERLHARYDQQRRDYRHDRRHDYRDDRRHDHRHNAYRPAPQRHDHRPVYRVQRDRYGNYFNVLIQQPGLLFGWSGQY